MNARLDANFRHYNIEGVPKHCIVEPSQLGVRATALLRYLNYLEGYAQKQSGTPVEMTPLQHSITEQARQFVAGLTGIYPDCAVQGFTGGNATYSGIYSPELHTVDIRLPYGMTKQKMRLTFGGVIVHEFMHSTGVDTVGLVALEDPRRILYCEQPPHDTRAITPGFKGDSFFEEGFSEEGASRWRAEVAGLPAGSEQQFLQQPNSPALPIRMFTYDGNVLDGTQYNLANYNSGYAAFGIQILSEYTGVDIAQLLIDARYPDKNAEAVSLLQSTINGIRPELFESLMGVEYTYDGFTGALATIHELAGYPYAGSLSDESEAA